MVKYYEKPLFAKIDEDSEGQGTQQALKSKNENTDEDMAQKKPSGEKLEDGADGQVDGLGNGSGGKEEEAKKSSVQEIVEGTDENKIAFNENVLKVISRGLVNIFLNEDPEKYSKYMK